MKSEDQKLLFTALGFMAVTLQPATSAANGAARARDYATLIEEYCRTMLPEAFDAPANDVSPS